ncbi:hypothetical protein CRYUN_Cryun19dG0082000 [Craigia yunnanensis]
MKEWIKGNVAEEIDFMKIEFWVQIHNLPVKMMTLRNVKVIGERAGRLVKLDE